MATNQNLIHARTAKNDEFYTRYEDIEAEINAYFEYDKDVFRGKTVLCPCDDHEWSNFTKFFATNFERFGLKKLISTSYAKSAGNKQTTIAEFESPLYDRVKHDTHGKLFILTRDTDGSGVIDQNDVEFKGYLKGDGDFRSPEVCALRDEADVIVTNPPFSLFREFVKWIGDKRFIVMGNKNAITYKEMFPLLKDNQMWVGYTTINGGRWMILPKDAEFISENAKKTDEGYILNVPGVCWFSNIEHGKRHETLMLDTADNLIRYNLKLTKKFAEYGVDVWPRYTNYDAIEVPFVECIPSDYDGMMGVPITFMDKYNPSQFTIVGITRPWFEDKSIGIERHSSPVLADRSGNEKTLYPRLLIVKNKEREI